jgi:hypothetical protein
MRVRLQWLQATTARLKHGAAGTGLVNRLDIGAQQHAARVAAATDQQHRWLNV